MRSSALLPFALLVMAVTTVPSLVLDEQGLPRYRALRLEASDLRISNQELLLEVTDLRRQIQALRADLGSVERIARDELGMVRPAELVFQFEEE